MEKILCLLHAGCAGGDAKLSVGLNTKADVAGSQLVCEHLGMQL